MFIAAFDVESTASFLITIPFPKAHDIVEMFGHNFEQMSEYLSFSRNKLVMLNPVCSEIELEPLHIEHNEEEKITYGSTNDSKLKPGYKRRVF